MKLKKIFFDQKVSIAIWSLSVVSLVLFAWNDDWINPETQAATPKAAVQTLNPCQVALAEHAGESPIDQDILRYQELSHGVRRPDAYLERLGWAYVSKARTSFDPGYFKLAQQTALCLDQRYPNNLQAQLLLGHVLHNLHRFNESEKIAQALVDQRGLWLDYALLGDALMEQGALSDAAEAYQQMLDQRPGPQAYFRAAHLRWLKGDLPGAIELMHMVVGAVPSKGEETATWSFVRLAGYERQANHIKVAEAYLSRALELKPDYAPALLLKGEILMARGAHSEAVQILSRAVNLNPLPLYQWTYREALLSVGDSNQADKMHQQMITKGAFQDRRSFAMYLASTRQQTSLALSLARQELEVRQDVFTLDTLAWALRANGYSDEAHRLSSQALAEGTVDARLLYHAAVIADEMRLPGLARERYAAAISLKHLLLPSERLDLQSRFAVIQLRNHNLAANL